MGYKMKGPSLYKHLTTKPRLSEGLHVNHDAKTNVSDGRAGSSAFQMQGDLDKDGKMSGYETARQTAIEKNMKKGPAKMYGKKSPTKMKDGKKTKEDLLKEGFTPADADKMMKDGATTGRPKAKAKKKDKPMSQEDFKPAYPGADYSKADIAKMTEKEKISKIDGYTPKKTKKK